MDKLHLDKWTVNQDEQKKYIKRLAAQLVALRAKVGISQGDIAQNLGYTVIRYDGVCSDEDVAVIADSLDLRGMLERAKGFIYTDKNYRLVFVNRDLTEQEAVIVFLHELGHIYLGHTERATAFGYDVIEEYAASEFVHYMLDPLYFLPHKAKNVVFYI